MAVKLKLSRQDTARLILLLQNAGDLMPLQTDRDFCAGIAAALELAGHIDAEKQAE